MNACSQRCGCGCGAELGATSRPGSRPAPRFIKGHNFINRASDTKRYKEQGTKRVHVIRAERALGKPLPIGAEVHHADGSIRADAPLVICQDKAYHRLLHARMRVVRAGGNPDTQAVCSRCGQPKDLSDFYVRKTVRPERSHWASAFRITTCKPCIGATS